MQDDALLASADAPVADFSSAPRSAAGVSLDDARAWPRSIANITIEIARGERLAEIELDWRALVGRTDTPNVFMNPLLVKHAGDSYPASRCFALLAWHEGGSRRNLVGVWAFAIGRPPRSIMRVDALTAPPMAHAYLATPVIDRGLLDATLEAMLTFIASEASLPKTIALDAMSMDGTVMQALGRVLAMRGTAPYVLERGARPILASDLDGKHYWEKALSGSSRKKLRQHRRRLAEKGTLTYRILTTAADVERALEDFLKLEATGWKGRQGTALLGNAADAAYVRAMIATLAMRGQVSIHALTLNDRPVSMQIVLRAGATAFTWKTAYDEAWRDSSPGMLLLEDYTATLLADDSIARVDSCTFDESSFMAVWTEREAIATLWLDATPGGSSAFTLLTRLQSAYLRARNAAKAVYLAYHKRRKH